MPKIVLPIVLLLLGDAAVAVGQFREDGSVYSRFGLGELRSFSSSQTQAMGGGGTALWSYNYTNLDNPASWSRQVLVRAVAGMRLDGIRATDTNNNVKTLHSGSLGAVQFGVPLKNDRLGLALAFEPFSRTNYLITMQNVLITDPTLGDTTSYRIDYEGTGGLQLARIGLGVQVVPGFSVGAGIDFLFGITAETRRTSFASTDFTQTVLSNNTRAGGVTGSIGVIASRTGILAEQDDISVAARLRLPATLQQTRTRTLGESLNRDTLGTDIRGDSRLPLSARFGVAYHLDNRWAFTADWLYEPWSAFESDLELPGYTPGGASGFRDRSRISGGIEWQPGGANLLESYFERVAYRLGIYYDGSYVAPAEDVDLTTRALTGGFSLPALLAGARMDVNFEFGSRGATDGLHIRDRFITVSATLNVGERWFVKRKLR